jgi:hypothetical protein
MWGSLSPIANIRLIIALYLMQWMHPSLNNPLVSTQLYTVHLHHAYKYSVNCIHILCPFIVMMWCYTTIRPIEMGVFRGLLLRIKKYIRRFRCLFVCYYWPYCCQLPFMSNGQMFIAYFIFISHMENFKLFSRFLEVQNVYLKCFLHFSYVICSKQLFVKVLNVEQYGKKNRSNFEQCFHL